MEYLKVLVVDDEPGIRSGVQRILKNFTVGYPFMDDDFAFELLEAGSGEQALEIIQGGKIDIVLLDNKLPGMDGIEVLEYINRQHIDTLVMMITSYASLDLAVKATQNGAYNFVPKPFTPQELRSAMENITKHLFLRRMTRDMDEEGKKARSRFLAVLSHELKSPINAIEGYLKMMQERQVGTDINDYSQMIDRSLERIKGMRTLIRDLLDLTRIEMGTKELKNVDISEIARRAIDAVEIFAQQRKVKIHADLPENTNFKADPSEIEIIFNNLLSNAIKYNKAEGEVFFAVKDQGNVLSIIVEDTGIGMSSEETAQLFQEFVRIKNEKTKYITGSGLGLSIVKKIVSEYNGEISVKSEPDKGTLFNIRLPK